jgi:hypothetical protein
VYCCGIRTTVSADPAFASADLWNAAQYMGYLCRWFMSAEPPLRRHFPLDLEDPEQGLAVHDPRCGVFPGA